MSQTLPEPTTAPAEPERYRLIFDPMSGIDPITLPASEVAGEQLTTHVRRALLAAEAIDVDATVTTTVDLAAGRVVVSVDGEFIEHGSIEPAQPAPSAPLTVRERLAAELHRIADDLLRLELPVGGRLSLALGVLTTRADLDRWAAYLGAAVQVDNNGIPHVDHSLRLGSQYEELAVRAQTAREPRSEVERLRAENAALVAQVGAAGGTR